MMYAARITSKILLATAIAMTTLAFAPSTATDTTKDLCHGVLPENDMKIPVGFKTLNGTTAGLTEIEFNAVLDRLEKMYAPVIAKAGGNLKINRLWTDSTVNASAEQRGRTWLLNMYGGMARHPFMTVEGFATVACHELGHHLGGAPKIASWFGMNDWATNEGGAD